MTENCPLLSLLKGALQDIALEIGPNEEFERDHRWKRKPVGHQMDTKENGGLNCERHSFLTMASSSSKPKFVMLGKTYVGKSSIGT